VQDEGLKKQRRDIEKKMTVHVQQISATTEQVRVVSAAAAAMEVAGRISHGLKG